jgi:hypothetical protein
VDFDVLAELCRSSKASTLILNPGEAKPGAPRQREEALSQPVQAVDVDRSLQTNLFLDIVQYIGSITTFITKLDDCRQPGGRVVYSTLVIWAERRVGI